MILMAVLIIGSLIFLIFRLPLGNFFEKLSLTINLDSVQEYFITCLWRLGFILFLFEMFIAIILFVIVSPVYVHKKISIFLKNVEEIPETIEDYNCY